MAGGDLHPASATAGHGSFVEVVAVCVRYLPLLIMLAAWEMAGRSGLVSQQMLPGVGAIATAFFDLLQSGELVTNAWRSLSRAATGLGLAVIIGIAVGLLMATRPLFRTLINPLVRILYPMPKSALIPLVMIWFGLGDASKIFLIFLGCLLPVIVSAYHGARGVNPFVIWSATSLGASKEEVLREIILPAALPDILAGCRTALAFSFILMVSSEFVIAKDGLGFLIGSLGDGGNYPAMFAVILTVAGTGFVADRLFGSFVNHCLRWKEQA